MSDADKVAKISSEIENNITTNHSEDVDKVMGKVNDKVIEKLNPGKSDPTYKFLSDCFKVNSSTLYNSLTNMVKSFLFHFYVPEFLLIATLVHIIKDKLDNVSSQGRGFPHRYSLGTALGQCRKAMYFVFDLLGFGLVNTFKTMTVTEALCHLNNAVEVNDAGGK